MLSLFLLSLQPLFHLLLLLPHLLFLQPDHYLLLPFCDLFLTFYPAFTFLLLLVLFQSFLLLLFGEGLISFLFEPELEFLLTLLAGQFVLFFK